MRNGLRSLVLTLGLLMALTPAAVDARNFCVNPGTPAGGPSLAVGEKFTLPTKGSCSPFNGFDIAISNQPRLVTGTACLDTDGHTLRVSYVLHAMIGGPPPTIALSWTISPIDVNMELPYPSLQDGSAMVVNSRFDYEIRTTTAHANWCIPANPPLPFP
jgi:hypothetical protein